MTTKSQKPHKVAQRSCVACRETDDKRTLVRFVRLSTGEVAYDPTGRQAGRGAYLCAEQRCFDRARKGHLLDRALKIKLNDADYQQLAEEFTRQRVGIDTV